jgi:hypothetical protein
MNDAEEERLAHELLYVVIDVFPDRRHPHEAWKNAVIEVRRMQRVMDEQHGRIKVLEAQLSGAATPITSYSGKL